MTGDRRPGIEHYRHVVEGLQLTKGRSHPETLRARLNLAEALLADHYHSEAMMHLEQLVADSVPVWGPDHPDTLLARHTLAVAYGRVARIEDGIEVEGDVLNDAERVLGPDHPDTVQSRAGLAWLLVQRGRIRMPGDARGALRDGLSAIRIVHSRVGAHPEPFRPVLRQAYLLAADAADHNRWPELAAALRERADATEAS
ncbi:tetratricopeptide repeat protein [Streptomyces sp. NPDC057438]|uniref:tetratricopeptide repeat protein n=1 Tax=Streptomyces sp. NPDC057438 TaxID=3346133 RepID=UPI0036BC6415